jgi:hypothetical protein
VCLLGKVNLPPASFVAKFEDPVSKVEISQHMLNLVSTHGKAPPLR